MLFVNTTPLVASLSCTPTDDPRLRVGLLVVKATYRLTGSSLTLDVDAPEPIRVGEEAHPLGTLPRELLDRAGDDLEVLFLGNAHAPAGEAVDEMRVALTVNRVRRELAVLGDRVWEERGGARRISAPEPFVTMPLGWSRAYGGSEWIEVDDEAFVEVADERNPLGKGFDASAPAELIRAAYRAPVGRAAVAPRTLPNVEDPKALVRDWADAPHPVSWAPLPMNHPLRTARTAPPASTDSDDLDLSPFDHPLRFHAAESGWILPAHAGPIDVAMDGLSSARRVAFTVPELAIRFDMLVGEAATTIAPRAHLLVIRPDDGIVTVTYRVTFTAPGPSGAPRSARLRTENHEVSP